MMGRRTSIGFMVATLCLAGCGDDANGGDTDSGVRDAAPDGRADVGPDAAGDASSDDGGSDAGDDAAEDASADTAADVPGDAAVDTSGFESFRYSSSGGPCPPDTGCSGYIEVLADGTFTVDKLGEFPEAIHTETLSADELAELLP